ncbi:MAG: type II secretion system minor pseudopilin GspK [Pseudomonadota bacterium]
MTTPHKIPDAERGSALVTVLMMVAAMALVAVGISQTVNAATKRSGALSQQMQARYYAVSAEAVVRSRVADLLQEYDGQTIGSVPGFSEPVVYPLSAGSITVHIRDRSNCFNVNGLVIDDGSGQFIARDAAYADFLKLAELTGLDRAQASTLGNSLIDWMDSDNSPRVSGAEDSYYSGERPSYRTAGQPMTNRSEINLVREFDPAIRNGLMPYLCALPDDIGTDFGPLNVNTLTVEQAGLLALVFPDGLTRVDAENLIASRPVLGWRSVEQFLAEPRVANFASDTVRNDRLAVTSTHLSALADIAYRDQSMTMEYLMAIADGQPLRLVRRERVG